MEPAQLLWALFYLWLLAALGVWAWRGYRRFAHHETRKDREARRAAESGEPGGEPGVAAGPVGATDPAIPGEPGDDRRGVFARQVPAHRPVADAVAGIIMPCGLVPLVTGTTVDPHHVVFATSDHDAGTVGAALADELERLGFTVRSLTDTEAVAVKAADEVRVTVHPDAPPAGVVVELAT